MTEELTPLQRKLAERRAREAAQQEVAKAPIVGLEDFQNQREAEFEQDALIQMVKGLSADIAISFITEKTPKPTNFSRKDGIKFRCPHSDHTDRDPSAWINSQKGLWTCGACETGGDWVELAAAVMGYRSSQGWRDRKGDWPKFRDELALLFNWKDPEPEPYEVKSNTSEVESNASEPKDSTSGTSHSVADTIQSSDKSVPILPIGAVNGLLDWRTLFPEDSFLHKYLTTVTIDDSPEEFHFASGLLGLGMALGRTVTLRDNPPVHGNLFVCVIGQSGSGKSKAGSYLKNLLYDALPYDRSDPMNRGAKMISNPGSGEVLYEHFSRPIKDPSNDKKVLFWAEVRGVVAYSELAGLTGRAARTGATLKSSLIDLYDCPKDFSISSRTHGETHGEMPYGSMMTSTQPGSIQRLVSSDDDKAGFLNRFIFLTGTPKRRFAVNLVEFDLTPAADALKLIERWGNATFGTGGFIEWSREGAKEWEEFYHRVVEPDQRNSTNDMLGRIDLLMKKLILLFTANKLEETVSATTVREACSLYEYFLKSYGFTAEQIDRRSVTEVEDKILITLRGVLERRAKEKSVTKLELADWPTARELQQLVTPKMTSQELNRYIAEMVTAGILEEGQPQRTSKVGRPPARRYVPVQYAE